MIAPVSRPPEIRRGLLSKLTVSLGHFAVSCLSMPGCNPCFAPLLSIPFFRTVQFCSAHSSLQSFMHGFIGVLGSPLSWLCSWSFSSRDVDSSDPFEKHRYQRFWLLSLLDCLVLPYPSFVCPPCAVSIFFPICSFVKRPLWRNPKR